MFPKDLKRIFIIFISNSFIIPIVDYIYWNLSELIELYQYF